MDDDWGLQAVVRGCTGGTTTSSSAATTTGVNDFSCLSSFQFQQNNNFMFFPDLFQSGKMDELHHLYKPFLPKIQPLSPENLIPISPLSVLGGLQDLSDQQKILHSKHPVFASTCTSVKASATRVTQHPRSKRRKNQMKRVCQVPAEGLSTDMWSWRKYGQKPIKGSPYPRGYYRCSTSKGCLARKQVERNRSDPTMFIVTYTSEHSHPMPTHRNSLAGSTRQKITIGDATKFTASPPNSPATSLSPGTENIEIKEEKEETMEEDEDEFGFISDDFFMGLDEVAGPAAGNSLLDEFPAELFLTPAAGGI